MTPTSELATQVREVVKQLSFGGLRSRSLLANNVSKSRTQIEALVDGVDIVVGTPGRVARLIEEGKMLTDDVDAVKQFAEEYAAAWAKGDPELLPSCYADDAVVIMSLEDPIVGTDALRELYQHGRIRHED